MVRLHQHNYKISPKFLRYMIGMKFHTYLTRTGQDEDDVIR